MAAMRKIKERGAKKKGESSVYPYPCVGVGSREYEQGVSIFLLATRLKIASPLLVLLSSCLSANTQTYTHRHSDTHTLSHCFAVITVIKGLF